MRYSVLATRNLIVMNSAGRHEHIALLASDRRANGEAFPDETVVRLPRSLCKVKPWETEREMLRRLNLGIPCV